MPEVDVTNMTASEIDNLKVEKEKEYKAALETLHEVEIKELEIAKDIVGLQSMRKEYQIAASKARHTVRVLALDVKILTSEFWRAKDNR
jgi:putative heme iron utilization protein